MSTAVPARSRAGCDRSGGRSPTASRSLGSQGRGRWGTPSGRRRSSPRAGRRPPPRMPRRYPSWRMRSTAWEAMCFSGVRNRKPRRAGLACFSPPAKRRFAWTPWPTPGRGTGHPIARPCSKRPMCRGGTRRWIRLRLALPAFATEIPTGIRSSTTGRSARRVPIVGRGAMRNGGPRSSPIRSYPALMARSRSTLRRSRAPIGCS